jgi:MFS family permease
MGESPAASENAQTTPYDRKLQTTLYIVFALFYWMSLYLYAPTLPTYTQTKSDRLALVGVVLAQYGLWQALIRLPLGIVADWLGRRKPLILGGIILAGLGAWVMGTADGTAGLAAGRAITGLAAGTWVPLTVAFSSLFPAREAVRATSILVFFQSVGRVAATSVTGSLNQLGGYPLAFKLAAGFALLALLILLPVREKPKPVRPPSLDGVRRLATRREVLVPALLAAVNEYVNWGIAFGFLPILAEQLGASDVALSLLMSLHISLLTGASLLSAAIARRTGARRLVLSAALLSCAGIGLAALVPSLLAVFVAQACLGIAQGTSYPNLMGMSIRDVADHERATAMGLHQAVYAIGMFAGPWLSGQLADLLHIRSMFSVTALGALAAAVFLVRLLPTEQTKENM